MCQLAGPVLVKTLSDAPKYTRPGGKKLLVFAYPKGVAVSKTQCKYVALLRLARASHSVGWLNYGHFHFRCAIGPAGLASLKREGDGATPLGRLVIRKVLYRADRIARPKGPYLIEHITPRHGWCDAAGDPNYNRPVRLPYPVSHERLWRDDGVYDLIAVLGHNDLPRQRNRGSCIFMHIARPDFSPTAGCLALGRGDLQRLLAAGPRAVETRPRR
jgi:L,D-peptidoglycan transpeptidase YkuD (ErfK/YbiS/YcfS/YnhG family)